MMAGGWGLDGVRGDGWWVGTRGCKERWLVGGDSRV